MSKIFLLFKLRTFLFILVFLTTKPNTLPAQYHDSGEFFSGRIDKILSARSMEIKNLYNVNFTLETYRQIFTTPHNQKYSEDERVQLFLNQRLSSLSPPYIYLAFFKNPSMFLVQFSSDLIREGILNSQDTDNLKGILGGGFHSGAYDATILEGVGFLRDRLSNTIDGTRFQMPVLTASDSQSISRQLDERNQSVFQVKEIFLFIAFVSLLAGLLWVERRFGLRESRAT